MPVKQGSNRHLPPVETRFKPGQSGNPSGRPKKRPLTRAYEELLDQEMPGDPKGRTYAEKVAEAMLKSAARGNVQAAREVADRVEGKAAQDLRVKFTQLFERMTDQELDSYAKDGTLPAWFQGETGADEDDTSGDTDA